MLKDSRAARVFIRVSILALRLVAPLSTVYCCLRLFWWTPKIVPKSLIALDCYAASESLLYFLFYLPRRWWLNLPAPPYLPLRSPAERRYIFEKTWEATPDPRGYLSLWFKGAVVQDLHREDVKDWIYWRMWNTMRRSAVDEHELEEYLLKTESVLKLQFKEGHGSATSMMVTIEPLRMMHRPLMWYLLMVGGADLQFCFLMTSYGYRFYSLPLTKLLKTIPFRPLGPLSPYRSTAQHLSYWHREHTSSDHLPVFFIHGIGVGLHYYLNFFNQFLQETKTLGIGLIALEVLPISSRVTHPVLHRSQMTRQIRQVLNEHGWSRCVLMTHSYGSVIASHMLHDAATSLFIGPLLFVDPVAFSFHPPEVAWNFLRREPTTASEIQLQYFASLDPGVAHALTRSFVWVENSLWREDVEGRAKGKFGQGRRCTVALAEKDIITDTETLGRYLSREIKPGVNWFDEPNSGDDEWKYKPWTGDTPLEVIWSPGLNHAEVFDDHSDRQKLIEVLKRYSKDGVVKGRQVDNAGCVSKSLRDPSM